MKNFEDNLHRIEDDIRENSVEEWAEQGVAEAEAFLAKYQKFAVESIVKAMHLGDSDELASWGLSQGDVLASESEQLAA